MFFFLEFRAHTIEEAKLFRGIRFGLRNQGENSISILLYCYKP